MDQQETRQILEEELEKIEVSGQASPAFFKKKLIAYVIRTILAIAIFFFLRDESWIMWAIIAYIPINLFGLYMILSIKKKVDQRLADITEKLNAIEEASDE